MTYYDLLIDGVHYSYYFTICICCMKKYPQVLNKIAIGQ